MLPLQDGDIVFQKLPCGGLCDAIIATTPCVNDRRFNHCGIVHVQGNSATVVEAIGKQVQETSLGKFMARDMVGQLAIARVKSNYRKQAKASVSKAEKFLDRPYDAVFLPGDSSLYCSELVWESYLDANTGEKLFSLQPMTFKENGATHPKWQEYYQQLGASIPEGLLGINPCAIANSDKVEFFSVPKQLIATATEHR